MIQVVDHAEGCIVPVRAQPGARQNGIVGEQNGALKVAHCVDTACSSATFVKLDAAGMVGTYTSITIGADGLGLISYYDATNGNLKVAASARG